MALEERYLVTGGLGCIGAWVVRGLVQQGIETWIYDLPGSTHRIDLILDAPARQRVQVVADADITDLARLDEAMTQLGITHLVHLAALQHPMVQAAPVTGAMVNVGGTAVVLEAVRRHAGQVRGFAYASSVAVYGPADGYPAEPLRHDSELRPTTLYGIHKQATEAMAARYWDEHRVASIGLRPHVVYGPGRDQGITSKPTLAMIAAAAERPYEIPYTATFTMQWAEDVATAFIRASSAATEGASVFNLGGTQASIGEVAETIQQVSGFGGVTQSREPLSVSAPTAFDDAPVEEAVGALPRTSLRDGVTRTLDMYRSGIERGLVDLDALLPSSARPA